MRRLVRPALLLLAATACFDEASPRVERSAPSAPSRTPSAGPRADVGVPPASAATANGPSLAERILRDGVGAFPTDDAVVDPEAERRPPTLREFVASPDIESAVQFGCCVFVCEDEERLVASLEHDADADAVVALAALVRVRAPRHVDLQWRALCRLDLVHRDDPAWSGALAEARRPFTPGEIDAALSASPPGGRYGDDFPLEWAARAAGVTRHVGALPRLVELSRGEHLDVSLAAERSLEDFPGPAGDRALVECFLGWRYDACDRAGRAVAERNPGLLAQTLNADAVPDDRRCDAGLLLARVGSSAAVPHLCASVGRAQVVDGKMFDAIESLATPEQLPLVESLPATVRDEQRERARGVLAAVRKRLGR